MRLLAILLLSASLFAQTKKPLTEDEFIEQVYKGTALLYSQDDQGSMKMRCTATVIEKTRTGYIFVTAAHCVGADDEEKERVKPDKTFFFITPDDEGSKDFMKAKLLSAGYQHESDDFALLEVETQKEFPIVAIGDDSTSHSGDAVINIASPLGLGKQTFKGLVSSPKLGRPVVQGDINWTDAMLVQITGVNGGSSGSAIVCLSQRAICGFLVGRIADTETIAIPVSRFKNFRKAVSEGKYTYWGKGEKKK